MCSLLSAAYCCRAASCYWLLGVCALAIFTAAAAAQQRRANAGEATANQQQSSWFWNGLAAAVATPRFATWVATAATSRRAATAGLGATSGTSLARAAAVATTRAAGVCAAAGIASYGIVTTSCWLTRIEHAGIGVVDWCFRTSLVSDDRANVIGARWQDEAGNEQVDSQNLAHGRSGSARLRARAAAQRASDVPCCGLRGIVFGDSQRT